VDIHRFTGSWRLMVFRVSATIHQQLILDSLKQAEMQGISALGVSDERGVYVVVDCPYPALALSVESLVQHLDPGASRVHYTAARFAPSHPSAG
jgi:hypothetical protein